MCILIIKRLKALYKNSGIILFILRLPARATKTIANRINTFLYSIFLKEIGRNVIIEYGVKIENPRQVTLKSNIFIGKGTKIITENNTGQLVIENNVHIGNDCHIDHTGRVYIGEKTLFSEHVYLYSHTHGLDPKSAPVSIDKKIGSNCWFGLRSTILESSKVIGNSTILAAGGILTKSTEGGSADEPAVYVGVPAKQRFS